MRAKLTYIVDYSFYLTDWIVLRVAIQSYGTVAILKIFSNKNELALDKI